MDLDGGADTLSTVDQVTSHLQSSLDGAFTFLLQPPPLFAFPSYSLPGAVLDFAYYLREVATHPDWREQKLVQALGNPGLGGLDLFGKAIERLRKANKFGEKWAGDILQHIYEVMVREQNPILEAENHPFREYLERPESPEGQTESDSGSDSEYFTCSIESDEE